MVGVRSCAAPEWQGYDGLTGNNSSVSACQSRSPWLATHLNTTVPWGTWVLVVGSGRIRACLQRLQRRRSSDGHIRWRVSWNKLRTDDGNRGPLWAGLNMCLFGSWLNWVSLVGCLMAIGDSLGLDSAIYKWGLVVSSYDYNMSRKEVQTQLSHWTYRPGTV